MKKKKKSHQNRFFNDDFFNLQWKINNIVNGKRLPTRTPPQINSKKGVKEDKEEERLRF